MSIEKGNSSLKWCSCGLNLLSVWPPKDEIKAYDIWGATCVELEVDMLTGEKMVRRADVMEDTGASINPSVDIGQVEGAFVMGLGLWLSEILRFNPETGRLLTKDSWVRVEISKSDIFQILLRRQYL